MYFLHWGKKFKHGHGVAKNLDKALQSFSKGAVRGCAAAMVDAGLLLWELVRSYHACSFFFLDSCSTLGKCISLVINRATSFY